MDIAWCLKEDVLYKKTRHTFFKILRLVYCTPRLTPHLVEVLIFFKKLNIKCSMLGLMACGITYIIHVFPKYILGFNLIAENVAEKFLVWY